MPEAITAESAPNPSASASPAASETTTPEQNGTVAQGQPSEKTESADNQTPSADSHSADNLPENWEWDGNVNAVEPPFRKRALGMQRYLTKRSQELAEAQKKAEEFDRLREDPSYQQFLQLKQSPGQAQDGIPSDQSIITQDDIAIAQSDPKYAALINRVAQAEQFVRSRLNAIDQKQAVSEKSQEIQSVAELYPDFWDLYDAGILKPVVREIVDAGKGTILDAYHRAKEIETYYDKRALQKTQGRIQEKKTAFSSPPSNASEAQEIWTDNESDTTRIAFENALLGKKVSVRTRR